jgi:hypothetical protein
MLRNFALLVVIFVVSACGIFTRPIPIYTRLHQEQLGMDHNPSARQGWEDGCYSGYAVYGNHYYKAWYDYKRDATKVGDKQYEMNWYEGYHFCRQSANTLTNDGVLGLGG